MKLRLIIVSSVMFLFFAFPAPHTYAFTYFGGKVASWTETNGCPVVQTANTFLDAVCGVSGVCLQLEYGTLNLKGGFASPSAFTADFNKSIDVGVMSVRAEGFPIHFYQSFLSYGFTQNNSWDMGQVLDFTPSCNPCGNDIERKIFDNAGINMDKMCRSKIISAAMSLATQSCNATLQAAVKSAAPLCPTRLLCFVGSSHFGLPSLGINLCEPSISVGGFNL